CQQETNWSYSF
nr:immunoglobulin light chain junction region [Macaca mulatta]MOW56191.1 immunoglobulin light chain junction region [Macaca mulatta]